MATMQAKTPKVISKKACKTAQPLFPRVYPQQILSPEQRTLQLRRNSLFARSVVTGRVTTF